MLCIQPPLWNQQEKSKAVHWGIIGAPKEKSYLFDVDARPTQSTLIKVFAPFQYAASKVELS